MPRELNVISQPGSSSGGDACTYMWACAICDENETCQKDKEGHSRWLVAKRMERIEYKVLVMSNKGGVGKSTCTTNLAVSLALKGWHVGICDMDIHGPNIPKMVGAEGQKLKISTSGGIIPFQAYNMKIASMSFLLQNSDDPIIWRDAYKYEFINQLLGGVEWQDLNFLLIDLPPGTGNESVTTIDLLGGVSGALIITTPQEVALLDSRRDARTLSGGFTVSAGAVAGPGSRFASTSSEGRSATLTFNICSFPSRKILMSASFPTVIRARS